MKLLLIAILQTILILTFSILWCEFGYYYYIFGVSCHGWPEPNDGSERQNFTKIMVIADTHIMGPIKSVKVDKLRREWQMKQAFSISNYIYEPELIIFLGDIFDEASFSGDELFDMASHDFERIFAYNKEKQQRLIIPGNHDIGFHKQMIRFPYLMHRFHDRYDSTSSINLYKYNEQNIIASNSMSFYNDTCPFCSSSIAAVNKLADQLEGPPPILLTHIPLFRKNDLECRHPNSLKEVVKKNNIEGEDVLHKVASKFLLEQLRPRLVLSGHTHMDCRITHRIFETEAVEELTISSYNHKFAEWKPTFLLLSVNSTQIFKKHCTVVEEWIIVSVYVATVLLISTRLVFLYKRSAPKNGKRIKTNGDRDSKDSIVEKHKE